MSKPNIIYFHVHDQGQYVSPYGHPFPTPALQRMADQGITFRNAFCVAPSCSPSRAALLTGQYPHQCGMFGLTNQGWALNDYDQHLRKTLSDAGYKTALMGTHHVTDLTDEGVERLGYDRAYPQKSGHSDLAAERFTEKALDYLREDHDKPFFLALGYGLTHRSGWDRSFVLSYSRYGPLDTRFVRPIPTLPDTPQIRLEAALQQRATQYQDYQLERVLDCLDEQGLAENTLIFYTTDHGPGLPLAKLNLNRKGTGVSLVMRGPDGFDSGMVIDALASQIDIFPTLCDYLGLDVPEWCEGKSMMPLVKGKVDQVHDAIFLEQHYHGALKALRGIRTERYLYIRNIAKEVFSQFDFCCDAGMAKNEYHSHGAPERPAAQEQLYDLFFDPEEVVNLAEHPDYQKIKKPLSDQLDAWMRDSKDPALDNTIPEPPPSVKWAEGTKKTKQEFIKRWAEARENLLN